jgi:hypothetical protein
MSLRNDGLVGSLAVQFHADTGLFLFPLALAIPLFFSLSPMSPWHCPVAIRHIASFKRTCRKCVGAQTHMHDQ